ncbi:hypothetical protein [Polymorphospora rubra]|uniref:hypothetical protein n=1 Tax=Polymorphospora rubra TaxID=338584 RepID=UPI001BB30B9E|nr:hypothetical protein [Polymorphospora rubra]
MKVGDRRPDAVVGDAVDQWPGQFLRRYAEASQRPRRRDPAPAVVVMLTWLWFEGGHRRRVGLREFGYQGRRQVRRCVSASEDGGYGRQCGYVGLT